jgi:regulator of sigma E protease
MLLTAITFILILSVLVVIHELGHFFMARFIGVDVEEFGIGLPPMIVGKKFGKTVYSINWLPIGGFVRLAGEDDAEAGSVNGPSAKRYFWARSKKERAAILLAGVAMNFLLAVAITVGLLTHGVKEPSGRVHVDHVLPESPAAAAGLSVGDVITGLTVASANNSVVEAYVPKTPNDLVTFVGDHKGTPLAISVIRDAKAYTLVATPRVTVPKGEGPLGVAISDLETHVYSWQEAPGKAVMINVSRAWDMMASLGTTLWSVIRLHKPDAEVAGPIGIAQVTGQAIKFGWDAVLEFASILSLNLAVLNVLPIPALDGGRFAFVFLEKILGRKIKPAFEKSTHQVGMIILFALIILVSVNDIVRLARGG